MILHSNTKNPLGQRPLNIVATMHGLGQIVPPGINTAGWPEGRGINANGNLVIFDPVTGLIITAPPVVPVVVEPAPPEGQSSTTLLRDYLLAQSELPSVAAKAAGNSAFGFDWFGRTTDVGGHAVPNWALIGGAAVVAYMFMGGKKGRK